MNFSMVITADHDMTEDERLDAIDPLGDTFDSASMGERRIEITGDMPASHTASAGARLHIAASRIRSHGYSVSYEAEYRSA